MKHNFVGKNLSAIVAKSQAQYIAFAPFIFQATAALRDLNILATIRNSGKGGIELKNIARECHLPTYGVSVLLDFAISIGILICTENRYLLTNVGYFLSDDEMTDINFLFNQHFCYKGLNGLTESISLEKPVGLKEFGEWETLYPALSSLPDSARKSWFDFDHFYSDHAFVEALPIVFKEQPDVILDIGGNTGKWAKKCLDYNPDVQLVIMDLPQQLEVAKKIISNAGKKDRLVTFPCDMLNREQEMYQGADIIWMSQFLDCFSPDEIISILKRCLSIMETGQKLFIMETFIDRQEFDAAKFCLNATSLYFTCFANGNSRMYHSKEMISLIKQAGFTISEQIDNIGLGHTIIICEI